VLARLAPAWSAFVELGVRYDAYINCVVESYDGDRPAIPFDRDTVGRVAELRAAIDVDLYVLD
jgi:hypothetical protein